MGWGGSFGGGTHLVFSVLSASCEAARQDLRTYTTAGGYHFSDPSLWLVLVRGEVGEDARRGWGKKKACALLRGVLRTGVRGDRQNLHKLANS